MNTRTQVNNDTSSQPTAAGAATASSPAPAAATTEQAAPAQRPEKALSEPDENPAIPRDKYHGKGGSYALVDGKRVPVDDEGKPLPLDVNGDPIRPDAKKK
jgi:hypothetical protein